MKKFLFSLLALVAVTIGVSKAQYVVQMHEADLGYSNTEAGTVRFYTQCYVGFIATGEDMVPTIIGYTTGVHARLGDTELNNAVITYGKTTPLPNEETATAVNYIWYWDLSKASLGITGTGSKNITVNVKDFRYDPNRPSTNPNDR